MDEEDIQEISDILQSRHVIDALALANEYCLFLEGCSTYETSEINDYLRRVIPMLYIKGSLLPPVEADEDYITEKFVSEEHWENIYNVLSERYGQFPADTWPEDGTGAGQVAELLADIYQDLKDFVILFQKALTTEKQNALADFHESFQRYWGEKLTRLMPVLHGLAAGNPATDGPTDETQELW